MVIVRPFSSVVLAEVVPGLRGGTFVGSGFGRTPDSVTLPPTSVTVRVVVPSGFFWMVTVFPFASVALAEVWPGSRGGTFVGSGCVTGPDSVTLPPASVTVRVVVPSGFLVIDVVFPLASVLLAVVVPGLRGETFVGSG